MEPIHIRRGTTRSVRVRRLTLIEDSENPFRFVETATTRGVQSAPAQFFNQLFVYDVCHETTTCVAKVYRPANGDHFESLNQVSLSTFRRRIHQLTQKDVLTLRRGRAHLHGDRTSVRLPAGDVFRQRGG